MSDYYEDEYYEDPEPECMGVWFSVAKAVNGQLFCITTGAWNDGVHIDSGYWRWLSTRHSLSELSPECRAFAIQHGKSLKPGEQADISDWWLYDGDKDVEPEYDPDCPACLRNLPHMLDEHEAFLRRNYEASQGEYSDHILF